MSAVRALRDQPPAVRLHFVTSPEGRVLALRAQAVHHHRDDHEHSLDKRGERGPWTSAPVTASKRGYNTVKSTTPNTYTISTENTINNQNVIANTVAAKMNLLSAPENINSMTASAVRALRDRARRGRALSRAASADLEKARV